MLNRAATLARSAASIRAFHSAESRPRVILQVGPRDFSVLVWIRDEGETPVDRVAKDGIKAALTAAMLARKLQQEEPC